jgi:C-lobe and N-lobe beta barrels of Tf-binding protein B
MRRVIAVAALAALSGCGGGGTTTTTVPVMGATIPGGVVGRSFSATAARVETDTANPTNTSSAVVAKNHEAVRFLSRTKASVTFSGAAPVTVTYNSALGMFSNPTGTVVMGVYDNLGGVTNVKDMLFFVVASLPATGTQVHDAFVQGNLTPTASMPITGTATYAGAVSTRDGSGATAMGTFQFNATFGAAGSSTMTGTLTGALPADPSLVLSLTPVTFSGNSFVTALTTTAPGVTTTGSQLIGRFFGPSGNEVGGSVIIDTSLGTAAGVFGGSAP